MKTVYQCDVCGWTYDFPELAEACERNHIAVKEVIPLYTKFDDRPVLIAVSLENGEQAVFSMMAGTQWHNSGEIQNDMGAKKKLLSPDGEEYE